MGWGEGVTVSYQNKKSVGRILFFDNKNLHIASNYVVSLAQHLVKKENGRSDSVAKNKHALCLLCFVLHGFRMQDTSALNMDHEGVSNIYTLFFIILHRLQE